MKDRVIRKTLSERQQKIENAKRIAAETAKRPLPYLKYPRQTRLIPPPFSTIWQKAWKIQKLRKKHVYHIKTRSKSTDLMKMTFNTSPYVLYAKTRAKRTAKYASAPLTIT